MTRSHLHCTLDNLHLKRTPLLRIDLNGATPARHKSRLSVKLCGVKGRLTFDRLLNHRHFRSYGKRGARRLAAFRCSRDDITVLPYIYSCRRLTVLRQIHHFGEIVYKLIIVYILTNFPVSTTRFLGDFLKFSNFEYFVEKKVFLVTCSDDGRHEIFFKSCNFLLASFFLFCPICCDPLFFNDLRQISSRSEL